MSKVRAAVIGCGRIGFHHALGYRNEPQCEVVGLCDIETSKAENLNKVHGLSAKVYADYKEMLTREKPDLVSVALWTHLHLPVVRDCIAMGMRAVHCEKPVAGTFGEVQEMAKVAREGKTRLTFNHQRRFSWAFVEAKRILHSGELGGLQRMEVFNPDNILDWGTHMIDLIHMYNREVPVKWVMGQLDARAPKAWFKIPFEFAFTGSIRFENGVRAIVHSGDDKEIHQGIRLIASNGIIEIIGEETVRSMKYGEGKWLEQKSPTEGFRSGFDGMMHHLVDTLITGAAPEVRWERAIKAAETIYAMYESSRRRARIDLPLTGVEDHPFVTMLNDGIVGPARTDAAPQLKPEPAAASKKKK